MAATRATGAHTMLLVVCALSPTAGLALMDLISFDGDQLEVVSVAGSPLVGKTFGSARLCFDAAVLIGIVRDAGRMFPSGSRSRRRSSTPACGGGGFDEAGEGLEEAMGGV